MTVPGVPTLPAFCTASGSLTPAASTRTEVTPDTKLQALSA